MGLDMGLFIEMTGIMVRNRNESMNPNVFESEYGSWAESPVPDNPVGVAGRGSKEKYILQKGTGTVSAK